MALITKGAAHSMDISLSGAYPQGFGPSDPTLLKMAGHRIGPFVAGEALGDLAPCYIKNDGKLYQSTGAAANAAAKVVGYCIGGANLGDQAYLVYDFVCVYAAGGLTPGAFVYLGTAAGTLDTAATTGGTAYIGIVLDANRILLKQGTY